MYRFLIYFLMVLMALSAVGAGFFVVCIDGIHPIRCGVGFLVCVIICSICASILEYFYNYENE